MADTAETGLSAEDLAVCDSAVSLFLRSVCRRQTGGVLGVSCACADEAAQDFFPGPPENNTHLLMDPNSSFLLELLRNQAFLAIEARHMKRDSRNPALC